MDHAPPLPAGIGLRARHLDEIAARAPEVGFLEIHAENHLTGGPALRKVERLRCDHAMSVHGVGLSLGSADGLDAYHLGRVAGLVARLEPQFVSEHLAWSVVAGTYLNDLLPLPYTEESLDVVARNVERLQATLQRPVMIENPSGYVVFRQSSIPEPEFLAALVARTGCRLLCDVNNIFVSGCNLGFDPAAYLAALPPAAIDEIHLAGHARNDADGEVILIDDHGARVDAAVWALYRAAIARFGRRPTLIEWDTDVPALDVLLDEAARADREAAAAMATGEAA
ncbi:DUF692 domain-containing protein [Vineibacter terrae]|uniref:DUF692 domain-containing protein n=1 Tax=Vineibacter terrae TaxID=2586908 RepID=A0A5C8PC34_9HYPH|nr:DUF692 domain-containing protein [Vineibacter terrae]TXL71126.1 DUF692 domain-containing protein [Vineibacter terrae]